MTTRRSFVQLIPVTGFALFGAQLAMAVDVDSKDPTAVALGYVSDATLADKAKYPKYAAGQMCGNCQLFQGNAGNASGPCPLFAGKTVAAKGWCSAYTKKA